MKILFINTGPWGTGSFTLIKALTKELLMLGHQIKIFFPDANFESIDKEEYYSNPDLYHIWKFPIKTSKGEIKTFPLMITDPHPRNPHAITFKQLKNNEINIYEEMLQKELSKVIKNFNPDIIECHHIWYPCWIIKKMSLNYIVTAHHSDQLGFRYDKKIGKKAMACAKSAHTIIAVSELVKREVKRLYHVDEKKIKVVANGYDREVFREKKVNREELLNKLKIKIPIGARIVSFAGKLSRTKGIDILLQANKLLDPKMNIHFIVMGAGDIKAICKRMDRKSYSLNNIHFIGQQTPEDVADIHNICEISVMPSRSEGFGISALEAMACGLPMVVTACGGPENFSVGKVIEVGSIPELAEDIKNLLKLPKEEYQKLRKLAIKTAKKYSMESIALIHLDLYEAILKQKSDVTDCSPI